MPAIDVYRSLWRHRWFIASLTVLAAVVTYVFSSSQPKVYEASGLIRIQQRITSANDAFGSLELGKRLAQTYAQIVTTETIKQKVDDALPSIGYDDIEITADPVADVELLRVRARNESPETAASVANAAAAALEEFVDTTGGLRDQIVVIDRAGVPNTPVAPRPVFTMMLTIVLALLFNGALALLRDFLSDRLPPIEEIQEKFDKPVLATVPPLVLKRRSAVPVVAASVPARQQLMAVQGSGGSGGGTDIGFAEPVPDLRGRRGKARDLPTRRGLVDTSDASSEPFRTLRLSIDLSPESARSNIVVFTSAESGEGKSTIAANYALVSAANERRVLLVDADIRNPTQHEIFAIPRVPGLTDLIGAKARVADLVHSVADVGALDVLTAGTAVPRPGDLMGSRLMRELLQSLSKSYDVIVVDTPPVLSTSDGANVAASVGADLVFVVDRSQRSRRISSGLRKLDLVGVNVLGLVINREGRVSDYGYAA